MTPKLYMNESSPAVRAVLFTVKALNLSVETIEIHLQNRDHLTQEYCEINPQHTIPTLIDGDFVLWDSHAINIYLVEKYAKDDSLYPKDPKKKALVNQILYFDCEALFPPLRETAIYNYFMGNPDIPKARIDHIVNAYEFLDSFLKKREWVAGDRLTIADFSCIASISTLDGIVPISKKFQKLHDWYRRCQTLPHYKEINEKGREQFLANIKIHCDIPLKVDYET